MKTFSYIQDNKYFRADYKESCEWYYCTNGQGEGLFVVTPYERKQVVGTCDFSANNLRQFQRKLWKYLRRNDD